MARAKVVHSDAACTIIFDGDKRSPEPPTGVIKFPGGYVEVSRTSEGKYWAHLYRDEDSTIENSRINYSCESEIRNVPDLPDAENVLGIALLIGVEKCQN